MRQSPRMLPPTLLPYFCPQARGHITTLSWWQMLLKPGWWKPPGGGGRRSASPKVSGRGAGGRSGLRNVLSPCHATRLCTVLALCWHCPPLLLCLGSELATGRRELAALGRPPLPSTLQYDMEMSESAY